MRKSTKSIFEEKKTSSSRERSPCIPNEQYLTEHEYLWKPYRSFILVSEADEDKKEKRTL